MARDAQGRGRLRQLQARPVDGHQVHDSFTVHHWCGRGRSRVVESAGLAVEGEIGLFHAANIWFKADLSRYLAHRLGVLTFNLYPGPLPPQRLGALVCQHPFDEYVLIRYYDPDVEDLAAMTPEEARGHIEALVGEALDDVEIKGVSGWTVNKQLAKAFSTGGIFCVGDAVHRHPPSSGLGLNMSVADSYNLAWKVALVDRGVAGSQLLETHDSERRPIDRAGVERAMSSLIESLEIADALGLVAGQTEEEGWTLLAELDDPSPVGDSRRAALNGALELAHLQFNAVGLEVGYAYEAGALVQTEASDRIPARQPVLEYQPTTRPGNRVPHARLEQDGVPMSSIDLVDGLQFALLVGLGGDIWREAAERASQVFGVDIVVRTIGPSTGIRDPYGEWSRRREVTQSGAVLVRPDRHIAWRCRRAGDNPVDDLIAVLGVVLDRADLCGGVGSVPA